MSPRSWWSLELGFRVSASRFRNPPRFIRQDSNRLRRGRNYEEGSYELRFDTGPSQLQDLSISPAGRAIVSCASTWQIRITWKG